MILNGIVFWLTMLIMLLMTLVVVNHLFILVCPLCGGVWLVARLVVSSFTILAFAGRGGKLVI
jgi:hypothetical protein